MVKPDDTVMKPDDTERVLDTDTRRALIIEEVERCTGQMEQAKRAIKRGRWRQAAKHFDKAADRVTGAAQYAWDEANDRGENAGTG